VEEMMICIKCGTTINSDKICLECGARVIESQKSNEDINKVSVINRKEDKKVHLAW